ncbi:MAG: hypothetical protein ACOYON_14445 [Fimbriimonas sp.]
MAQSEILERPGPGESAFIDDASELFADSGFPDDMFVFETPEGKHGCINCEPIPVEAGYTVDCLAVFVDPDSVNIFRDNSGLTGKARDVTLEEARTIALAKPKVTGLALQIMGKTVALHYVR